MTQRNNKKILVYSNRGCFGDCIIALYSLAAYKAKYPNHIIDFYWKTKEFIPLAEYNPNINNIIYNLSIPTQYDKIYDVSDNICCEYEDKTTPVDKNRIEILCDVLDNCYYYVKPKVFLSENELQFATKLKNKLGNKFIIGVVSRTHSPVRNYDNFDKIYDYLPDDVHILVFKKYNLEFTDYNWDLKNTTFLIGKPIREVLSYLSICNVVIGCDTGLMHAAGGFDIPSIWLFGPTSDIAIRNYDKAIAINGKCDLGLQPCWYNLKCEKDIVDRWEHCLKDINPQLILNEIMRVYEKWS